MTPKQRYLFDLTGYIHLKPEILDKMLARLINYKTVKMS